MNLTTSYFCDQEMMGQLVLHPVPMQDLLLYTITIVVKCSHNQLFFHHSHKTQDTLLFVNILIKVL